MNMAKAQMNVVCTGKPHPNVRSIQRREAGYITSNQTKFLGWETPLAIKTSQCALYIVCLCNLPRDEPESENTRLLVQGAPSQSLSPFPQTPFRSHLPLKCPWKPGKPAPSIRPSDNTPARWKNNQTQEERIMTPLSDRVDDPVSPPHFLLSPPVFLSLHQRVHPHVHHAEQE